MSTEIQVVYQITEAEISERSAKYSSLTADTPHGYKAVQSAIGVGPHRPVDLSQSAGR